MKLTEALSDLVSSESLSRYGALATANSARGSRSPSDQQAILQNLSVADLGPMSAGDRNCADSCLAGLWLLQGDLDRSHQISQTIDSAEGSLWHAIMHRLEGDIGNSRYWYRRAGDHPVVRALSQQFPGYPEPLLGGDRREPAADRHRELARMAIAEWEHLFEYCLARAQKAGPDDNA